ncbi:baeRF2 domain-containing protein [Streptomyces sp. TP-A0874]|uniref:baeRF2 domain-containing protein n=1 Tax=Streptomyces sp. TP-A0874 TaxID=549819 RepID=UPI0008538F1E|nr:Vms1/Ankzf1 family peptidyl-tRNA hydrolase [Streptomyces sp. TP-A0874]
MDLAFLRPVVEAPGPWASVYMNTSQVSESAAGEQQATAREACDLLARQGADPATCRAVRDELASIPRSSGAAGYAVFAGGGEVVLSTPLATAPESGPIADWSALPHLGPLVDFKGEDPKCLVAYIDRTGADFELRDDWGRSPAGECRGTEWPVHRTGSADWSERHFQLRVENTWEHNAGEIAEALRHRWEETRPDLLVLVGDARERRAVHDRLAEPLREAAVEVEHGSRAAGTDPVLLDAEVSRARLDHVQGHTAQAVDQLRAGRAQAAVDEHDAVEGVPALVRAARQHRIGSLLFRPDGPDLHREVWVGREPDQIGVRHTELQYLGDTEPFPARADDALLRAAAAGGAEVLAVYRPEDVPDDLPAGGLGALLRWPSDNGHPEAR